MEKNNRKALVLLMMIELRQMEIKPVTSPVTA